MTNIVYFIEEKNYLENEINNKISRDSFIKLKELNILKKLKNGYFKFSFVGLISLESKFLVFLPKYLIYIDTMSNIQKENEIKLILKVLMKYAQNVVLEEGVSFLTFDSLNESFSLLALVEYIINDYLEYGLYSNEVNEYEYNGDGDISWENTVENELVYRSNKQYIYLDYITNLTYSDDNSYISQLHKMIINKSLVFMKKISFLELFDFPNITFNIDENALGHDSFQIKKIDNEMSVSFSQRKVKLLQVMKLFIENEITSLGNRNEFFYGTSYFNMVWEKVCSEVIQNDKRLFENLIPKPMWQKKTPLVIKSASKTLNPDILKSINNDFFIFDAKYYKPIFNNDKLVSGHPGVEDVSKQFLYELAFKHLGFSNYNIFVYPIYDEEIRVDGKVTFDLFTGLDLCDIYLLQFNPHQVFRMYLEEEVFDNTFFDLIKNEINGY